MIALAVAGLLVWAVVLLLTPWLAFRAERAL